MFVSKYEESTKEWKGGGLKRARYDIEDEFREKAKQRTKEKYEKDNDYREKVKKVGKDRRTNTEQKMIRKSSLELLAQMS